MIHLVTWLPLPYQLTLCRALNEAYGGGFVVWFAERHHPEFPYRDSTPDTFSSHYLAEEGYGKLFKALRSDPDAVVILCGWSSPMANKLLLMTAWLRTPVLIWADHPHPRKRGWLVERARKLYLRFLGRVISGFLACGKPTLEHLASLGIDPSKIAVFPCWAELPQSWSLPQGCAAGVVAAERPLRLIAVGRQSSVKQFNVAIEAVALANASAGYQIAELVMAGDGAEREHLEALAQSLGCQSSITFLGWLENEDVYSEIEAADALVIPSKFEAFSVVVLEAMGSGRPVLASCGVVAALDRDEGTGAVLLHPVGDVESLARQVKELAIDRERLRKASIAARATAEKWPPERAGRILNEFLARNHRGRKLAQANYQAHLAERVRSKR
jgi:glycosyltransferase involved in cell wall biosynthesis